MDASIDSKLILAGSRASLTQYRYFKNVAAALTVAMLLVADSSRPYLEALCRCKGCSCFYIARRTKKGELANPVYCTPACRKQYHNSAARKG
jgi:hypothetical protein